MTANANRRSAGTETAADQDANDSRGKYSDAKPRSRREPAPWYRSSPERWRLMTAGLHYEEKGLLKDMLDLMHETQRPLSNDPDRLRLSFPGLTKARIAKLLSPMFQVGAIYLSEGGLWSDYMTEEFTFREEKSEKMSKNSSSRWQKDQQKQSVRDANASREQRGERRDSSAGGASPQPASEISPDPSSEIVESGEPLTAARGRLRGCAHFFPGQTIRHPRSKLECRIQDIRGEAITVAVADGTGTIDILYRDHRTGELVTDDPLDVPF